MKLNNVTVGGKLFNFDELSNLTKTDLPKALELMSQMYLKGQLNTQTMQKMFTARHFMEISNLLIDINGNVDTFVGGIAKGVNYSDDFYKKMFDVNEQWKLLRNNWGASLGESGQMFLKSVTGISMAMNQAFGKDTVSNTNTILKNIGLMIASAVAVSGAIKGIGVAFALLTPTGALVTALIGAVLAIGKSFLDVKTSVADLNINLSESGKLTKKIEDGVTGLRDKYDNMHETMKRLSDENIWVSNISEANTLMDILLSKSKGFVDMMSALGEEKKLSDLIRIPKELDTKIKAMTEKRGALMREITVAESDMLSTETMRTWGVPDSIMENAKEFGKAYIEIMKTNKSIVEKEKEGLKMASDFGLTDRNAKSVMRAMGSSSGGKDYNYIISDLKKFEGNIKDVQESINSHFKDMQEQATKNITAFNKTIASINQDKLDIFMSTGEITLDKLIKVDGVDKIVKETFEGYAGVAEIAFSSVTAEIDAQKNAFEESIKTLQDELNVLDKIKSVNIDLTEEQQAQYKIVQDNLEAVKNNKELYNKQSENKLKELSTEKELFQSFISKYSLTSKNIDLMLQYWALTVRIQDRIENGLDVSRLTEKLELTKKKLEISEAEAVARKKTNSDYQLKYNNYVKENLSVELEIAKLLQSQGKQHLLSLEYKKRELNMNKELIADEVALAKATLGASGSSITTSSQAQAKLQSMYKQHGANTKNEDVKKEFESLKVLAQALVKAEKNAIEYALIPLKEFDELSKNLPNVMERVYTTMQGANSDVLSLGNQQYIEFLKKESIEAVNVIRESWAKNSQGKPILNPFEGLTPQNIEQYVSEFRAKVEQSRANAKDVMQKRDEGAPLNKQEEELIEIYSTQTKQLEDLLGLREGQLDIIKRELDLEQARLDIYNKMGSVISKLGSGMSIKGLEDIGSMFSVFGDLTKSLDKNKGIDFAKLVDFDNKEWASNFGKAMENAMSSINLGSIVGSWIGGITGGGASAQAGGSLGGLFASMGGAKGLAGMLGMGGSALATGGASLAISAGMSLIGGLFDKGNGDEEEAQKRTAEAKKIYDKNTDALNKLAQNMSNLSGGIDGLNSSLISSFSKIPTFGKLTSVTDTLKNMYSTMEKTRQFNEVAYQVTKTKKGKKGFLGIGATAGTSWTETIEVSVQQMLNRYGFRGTIEDMTTDQLRSFSKWLEDYDLGDTDNFSVLAGAIEDYAEALDTFDRNIEKFFYDTTMESFAGISSLQQEELRQQIEDFYKNLGFQIDDELSKEIDKLAESMSVMVTIMQDVRGNFIDSWRDTGKMAGQAFLSSMTPFVDAMLENISQVFYDVYFSDVTEVLEKEFKTLSEQLVELKKQGSDLNWDNVASSLSGSFDKVLSAIISAKQESADFNDILMELQKQALEAGLSLSEILELGLVSGTQKTVLDTFKDALLSSENDGALISIGQMVGDKVGDAMADKLIDNMLSDKVLQFSANIDKVLSGGMNFDSLSGLASEAMSVGMMMETERKRLEAIKDLFNFDGDISYESQESNIQYSSGTSSSTVNHYYLTSSVEAGNVIESDSVERLADSLLDTLITKLKVDRGIDITKNY